MQIKLVYALSEGPRISCIVEKESTSAAIDYAISLGAVVAIAKLDVPNTKE